MYWFRGKVDMAAGADFEMRPARHVGSYVRILALFGALCLSVAVVYRYQIGNGFSVLLGDRYDAVISATILEHWFNVFLGRNEWSEVNYFFPYTETIAQTDAFFLVGVAYFPFRILGIDQFLSAEFAGVVIKAMGFVGAYLLGRQVFRLPFGWAMVVAILFTLNNGMTSHGQRLQLSTVALAPFMALLLWCSYRALLDDNPRVFRRAGVTAGILYGAWCLTCFYMAWFFTLFIAVFSVTAMIGAGASHLNLVKEKLLSYGSSVLFVLTTGLLSLLPFAYVFVPKAGEVGVRAYDEVLQNTVPLEGVLQVGNDNYLLGEIYNQILAYLAPGYSPQGEYYNTGFSIVLFVLFVGGCVQAVRHKALGEVGVILKALIVAALLTWLLALNIAGHSGWYFVYHGFPGAKALRVVSAYQIFLALPVIIVAVKYVADRQMRWPITVGLVLLLVVAELNTPYLRLDRGAELQRIALPDAAPPECRVFYVSGWDAQQLSGEFSAKINSLYAHNVSAMMIGQVVGLPTINGMASFNPPDWNFGDPDKHDYDERVLSYATKHEIAGLCKLDLNSKEWIVLQDDRGLRYGNS